MSSPQPQLMVALVTIVALVAGIVIGGLYFGALSKPSTITVQGSSTYTSTATATGQARTNASVSGITEASLPGLSLSWNQVEKLASILGAGRETQTPVYVPAVTVATPTFTFIPAYASGIAPLKGAETSTSQIAEVQQQLSELVMQPAEVTLPSGARLYYSGTNVQVSGVDEPDIVKTNGIHIFIARGQLVEIYRAYPAKELALLNTINIKKIVEGLAGKEYLALVTNNKTQIIAPIKRSVYIPGLFTKGDKVIVVATETRWPGPLQPRTWILVLDGSGKVVHYAVMDGYFYDARLSNETLVLVMSLGNIVRPILFLGPSRAIAPAPVLVGAPTVQTVVASIDLETWNASTISLVGATPSSLYMTPSGDIYVVLPGSIEELQKLASMSPEEAAKKLKELVMRRYYENSTILHLRVSKGAGLELVATGSVPGRIWKQWMLDVYNNTLRIVTESWEGGLRVSLYILDAETLKPIGMLRNIALNERVYAIRFIGDTLYLVTYRSIDPLFAIDLSNPAKPRVIGYVKSPGFDEYLHPVTKNLLIGVGREKGWVRLTLYQIMSNRSVAITERLYLKGYTWSPVLDTRRGHRAFTLDPLHGYILIPVRIWRCYSAQEGIAVVKLYTKKPDIRLVRVLPHRYPDRALFINDTIYSVSSTNPVERVKAFNAKTLKEIASAPKPLAATIAQITSNPENFQDKAVIIRGKSLLWKGLDYAPPVSKSDWVLDDSTGRIYVAAYSPYQCKGTAPPEGAEVEVVGIVKMSWTKHPYIVPVEVKIVRK